MELTYTMQGDYLIPNLIPPEDLNLGKYGLLRHSFLQKHKKPIYTGMLFTGKLKAHLEETEARANEMMDTLMAQMAAQQGVNESLKARDQMEWVRRMNNIRNAAEEIVLKELIYS